MGPKKTSINYKKDDPMSKLIDGLSGIVKASITGLDRIVFKGIILPYFYKKRDS